MKHVLIAGRRAARLRGLALVAAAALSVAGCSAPSTPAVGQWQVHTATETPLASIQARPVLAALAPLPSSRTRSLPAEPQRAPQTGTDPTVSRPVYKIGTPYTVGNRTYVPAEDPEYDAVGRASWYGEGFHGKRTANGEIYDQDALVAAHPTLPMPCLVLVTNLRNGRTVILRVNNRGPYVEGRIIDVSRAAAHMLGFAHNGLTEVRVRYAGRAALDRGDDRERAHLAAQPWYRTVVAQRTAARAPP